MKMSNNAEHYYDFQPRHYQPGDPGYIDLSKTSPSSGSSTRSGSSLRSTSYYTHPSSASSQRSSKYTPHTQHSSSRRSAYPESTSSGYASSIGSYASEGYSGPSLSPDGRDRWVPPQPSFDGDSTVGRGGGRSEYSIAPSRTTTDTGASSRRSSLLSGSSGRDSAYGSAGSTSTRHSLTSSNLRRTNTHKSSSSSKYTEGAVWPTNSINWVVDPTRRAGERRQ